ncbi:MAG TPA: hypothetical protein VJV78_40605 [Polyangiales bacterium]|nr:hypothetical protein [Polyangiales bacterium]
MFRPRDLMSLLGVVAGLAACAGADEGTDARKDAANRSTPRIGSVAGSGAQPGASDRGSSVPSNSDFGGNPIGTVPIAPPAEMPVDPMTGKPPDNCEPGKFCEPKGPDGDCGSERLKTDTKVIQIPGNMMVIFDRSTSMEEMWNGTPRWQAAGEAFTNAIKPLEMLLNVGAIFFPSPSADPEDALCPYGCNVADPLHWIPGPQACCLNIAAGAQACSVNPIDQADQIKFGPASAFLTQAPMKWRFNALVPQPGMGMGGMMGRGGMMPPAGGMMPPMGGALIGATPLGAGVKRAAEAIMGAKLEGPLAVVILTDGEPNCDTNVQQVTQQVTQWHGQMINTHVIGLPGSQMAAQILTSLAMAGGTDKYLEPTNATELEAKIRAILTSTIRQGFESCTFHLDKATEVPDKLHLVVTEGGADKDVPRDLSKLPNWGDEAGWSVNSAGDTVELKGRLCEMAKEGTFEGIRFDYGCVDFPPPDPPPGPT